MINWVTSIISWFLKNVNMLIGIISAVAKLAVGIINFVQPSKDSLVDKITYWSEKVQKWLFKGSEILKKYKGSTE